MKKNNLIKCFFFVLLFTNVCKADGNIGTGSSYSRNQLVEKNINIPANYYANTWVDLGDLGLEKYNQVQSNYNCSGVSMCSYTAVRVNGGGLNPGAYYKVRISATPQKKYINGKEFIFSAYFKGSPQIIWQETNINNRNTWYHPYTVPVSNFGSSAGTSTDYSTSGNPSGKCGVIGGCSYAATTYFGPSSGSLHLSLQFPSNLASGTYQFNDVEILRLWQQSSNASGTNVYSSEAVFKISGVITLPNRCYISSSQNTFNFRDVNVNAENGKLETQEYYTITTCQGILSNVKQYLTVDGGNDDYIKPFSFDANGSKALGFAMMIVPQGLSGEPNCNAATDDRNRFNKEYLIRTITPANYQTFQDTLKFSLCKYGIPSSAYIGENNVSIKIISRWEN
ncbi:hypothetical protein [Escherichia coli]|uniref:hypothetical protein n=1 Tax=Escherichia coli TaxID=562 RepID=UPI0004DA9C04|nr:hypothetical protein [Escherichia coli]EHX1165071.1 hypothetical protein [Escherichia coli]KDW95673.1 putative fotG [Escherichia coli 2-210-07_S3_C2]OKT91849.1 hypothetical protein ACN75_06745 [Escherichia coli]